MYLIYTGIYYFSPLKKKHRFSIPFFSLSKVVTPQAPPFATTHMANP